MITASDFVRLPYTPDLTEGGIAYACRSLSHAYDRSCASLDRLRRTVAGVAVELAFRRYLSACNIPFEVRRSTPFTEPNHYDVLLEGQRCEIRTVLLSHRSQIRSVRSNADLILQAPAWIPLEQCSLEGQRENDLLLFAFVTALIAASLDDLRRVVAARQPVFLFHGMQRPWLCPRIWMPLGPLSLKSEAGETLELEIGGLDADREFLLSTVDLPPQKRLQVQGDFYSLAYLHARTRPTGRLGIHSPTRRETCLIEPADWGNLWIYGMEILIAGWIRRSEFRRRAHPAPPGSRMFPAERSRTKNLAVPVSELHPMAGLLNLCSRH